MLHLEDYTRDELATMQYEDLCRLRRNAYRRHVAAMTIPTTLITWAALMAKRYGPKVQVWKNELPWLEALMVVRYGEALTGADGEMLWPTSFSDEDAARAWAWAKGRRHGQVRGTTPAGLVYLDLEGGFATAAIAAAIAAGTWVLAHLALLTFLASLVVMLVSTNLLFGPAVILIGSAMTNFWENEHIDHDFRARSYTAPTDHYIALYTAAPGETGGGTEVTGGSYARVQVAAGFANWEGTNGETTNVDSAGTGGGTQNINAITFPAPSANWGVASHFASLDASTSGNMYFYGALTASKTINNGDAAPSFPAGALDFAFA